jgi:hypothetical protein
VIRLKTDDYGEPLPRHFLKRSTFESTAIDSTCRPSSNSLDDFSGISPQVLYDHLALLQQIVAGIDTSRAWQASLLHSGMVLEDDRGAFLVVGASKVSVRTHRIERWSTASADGVQKTDFYRIAARFLANS